ncbi:MAG: FadR/GntR family transcriptional regulator [Flavobacteriales bacterium]|jgi:GntR family transcriptional regulator, transcriptional repressor for pyruvate dehydrogenase complex|nr:FadR family transcriptional regulator [Flavobacteriaceae bacterium]MDO7581614.1 FadR family transcriptional regulator [Flavobacteriaceae bacterium]MDO7590868.1 FadR family transcriptional regulator [Flavobacteriaceae bacterium]MDO7599655.1 FadR family transcriptional regulator [Flavobacteriaceae bacterium]MDO7603561.1 FadR family transcriptional regulator [Flavobacteriaceae bacterium]
MIVDTEIQSTKKKIISDLKDLINFKNLEPGDKLPSERMLSEKFNVSRGNLRDALQTLEYYGLVKSIPQSGTFVADIGITALNGMIDDILSLLVPSFKELVEARIFLELKGVKLAAIRRTTDDLIRMENALTAYSDKVKAGEDAVQEDLLFHLAIARASGNPTLNTFMLKITPEIINNFEKHHVCDKDTAFIGIQEHNAIIDAIRDNDPDAAKDAMKKHFKALYQYCYNIK